MRDKVEIALLHLRRLVELKGEKIGVMEMRNHASWYHKGVKGNGQTTEALNEAEIEPEIRDVLKNSQQERMEQSIEIQEA